jgi:hypothetical protein
VYLIAPLAHSHILHLLACGLCALGLALSDSPRGSSQLPGVIRAGPAQVRDRVAMATQVMGEALNALIRKWS